MEIIAADRQRTRDQLQLGRPIAQQSRVDSQVTVHVNLPERTSGGER
jgi:hypothetical protein